VNIVNKSSSLRLLITIVLLCCLNVAGDMGRAHAVEGALTRESVVQFLHHFEAIGREKNFDLLEDMVHDDAFFRFNDGDFVGKQAVRGAFEKTWKGSAGVSDERFYLTDIEVLNVDGRSASATYTYNWEGSMNGHAFRIQGRGTRVLVLENGRLQMIHEHLSAYPKP